MLGSIKYTDTDSIHSSESTHSLDSQESYPVSQSVLYELTSIVWNQRQKQKRRILTESVSSVGRCGGNPQRHEKYRGNRTYRVPPKR